MGMSHWGFWDWVAYGGIIIAAIFLAVDTAIRQSEDLRRHAPGLLRAQYIGFIPLIAVAISASAFVYQQLRPADLLALPEGAEIGTPFGVVQAWGINNDVFYMVIKTSSLATDRKLRRVALILRVPFADIDQMTDTNIKKSQAYTILDGFMTLAVPITNGIPLKVFFDRITPIQFNLVELPSMFSPDQIRSLSDVQGLGGKILASPLASAQFKPVSPTGSQAACPPSPMPSAPPQ
jgi:hypothetical protein